MAGTGLEPEDADLEEAAAPTAGPSSEVPTGAEATSSPATGDNAGSPTRAPTSPGAGGPGPEVPVPPRSSVPPSEVPTASEAGPGEPHQIGAEPLEAGAPLRFVDAYLLTSGHGGPMAVPELTLELGEAGVALSRADTTAIWAAGWDEISELAAPERSKLPDGGPGVVLVITGKGRSHRFVVPADRPARLEAMLDALARRHGVSPERPERSKPPVVVVGVLVVLAGALTVLLLAAGHIIRL